MKGHNVMSHTYKPRKKSSSPKPVDPRIRWLRAMVSDDLAGAYLALVELYRDPQRWFASAVENGMPRLWARGDSEHEVRTRLECAVADHAFSKFQYRAVGDWQIVVHPPDDHGRANAWLDWPVDGAAA
jgi:hypothetical protein